jgi:flagellar protein FlaI
MTPMDPQEEQTLFQENPHLQTYLDEISEKMNRPVFYKTLPRDLKAEKSPNVIYPTKGVVFIHIFKKPEKDFIEYHSVEPLLTHEEKKKREDILEKIFEIAPYRDPVKTNDEIRSAVSSYIEEFTTTAKSPSNSKGSKRIALTPIEKQKIEYDITKELIGGGPLECFMRDPYLEDIHIITGQRVHLIHKIFEMVETNINIDETWASDFSQDFSEKIGSPVSEGQPIADGTLPDGSRVNIIHSKDVSLKGPTMTVRKFSETPISVTQLIGWGTFDVNIAAYLWLCLNYGRSLFVCGETASGKTTTSNAIIPFIPPEKKIYSVENTPEVIAPHDVWQQLLTKSTGPKESHIDMSDLLYSGLRSRPDYIIPGETRGEEGRVVFQAMQTGHPVITTFHAGSVTKVIQRFTGHPINVPKTFMDNLDVVLIQMAVERKGKRLRRVLSVDEIEGYNKQVDGIISRKAFEWNAADDTHLFKANRNSFILEQRIASLAGFSDPMIIYNEFDKRKQILKYMVEQKIFDYYEVVNIIWSYYRNGLEGLPFSI